MYHYAKPFAKDARILFKVVHVKRPGTTVLNDGHCRVYEQQQKSLRDE